MSKPGNVTKLGAVLLAVGASACCWLPLLLAGFGAGAAGAGAFFEALRPYLMAATIALLGGAFYFAYRQKTACADDGSCAPAGPRSRAKAVLWTIAALAAVSFAFPYWSASRLDDINRGVEEAALGAPAFEIPVDGMTCAACAVSVHESVTAVSGVRAAQVDDSPGRVRVWTEREVDPAVVLEAIREAGYKPGVPVLKGERGAAAARIAYIEVKGMVKQLGIT